MNSLFIRKELGICLFAILWDISGIKKWQPKLLYTKEELFVFEEVTEDGYVMPDQNNILSNDELNATVSMTN